MRGFAVVLGTCMTVVYALAAQAAMTADRADVVRRLAADDGASAVSSLAVPVWNGGTMAPITVEVEDSIARGNPAVGHVPMTQACPAPRVTPQPTGAAAVRIS